MKNLILQLIVCGAALLPITQAQAAGPAGKKLYGGFGAGKTFTFKVTDRTIGKASLLGGTTNEKKVPKGVPDYSLNKNVKFTIGKRGELTAKGGNTSTGFSTRFSSGSITSNSYVDKLDNPPQLPDSAIVFKNSSGKAEGVSLTFHKVTGSGASTTTYLISYTLE